MNANNSLAFARKTYDNVHMALWAVLVAFVLYFVVVVAPKMPEAREHAARLRLQEIAAEYNNFCQKWGMAIGTPANPQCVLDLQAFRARLEKRIADENAY